MTEQSIEELEEKIKSYEKELGKLKIEYLKKTGHLPMGEGRGESWKWTIFMALGFAYISMIVFLIGCNSGLVPAMTPSPPTPTHLLAVAETGPELTPTGTATAIRSDPWISSNPAEVLESAVARLVNAASFEMAAHEVRAYQIIGADGETRQVYGEFNMNYAVIRHPLLKVYQ